MSFLGYFDEISRLVIAHYNETYEFAVQSLNANNDEDSFSHFVRLAKSIPGGIIAIYNIYTVYKLIYKCYQNYQNKRKFSKLFNYTYKNKNKK